MSRHNEYVDGISEEWIDRKRSTFSGGADFRPAKPVTARDRKTARDTMAVRDIMRRFPLHSTIRAGTEEVCVIGFGVASSQFRPPIVLFNIPGDNLRTGAPRKYRLNPIDFLKRFGGIPDHILPEQEPPA